MTGTQQQMGIIPLAVHECFNYIQNQNASATGRGLSENEEEREYMLRLSYLEEYKEHGQC